MYLGKIVEIADRDELYENPLHPYTQALLSAVPIPDPALEARRERTVLARRGAEPAQPAVRLRLPSPLPDRGRALPAEVPPLREITPGHWAACHLADSLTRGQTQVTFGNLRLLTTRLNPTTGPVCPHRTEVANASMQSV